MDLGAGRLIAPTFSRDHESYRDAGPFAIRWWVMIQTYNERENCSSDQEQCVVYANFFKKARERSRLQANFRHWLQIGSRKISTNASTRGAIPDVPGVRTPPPPWHRNISVNHSKFVWWWHRISANPLLRRLFRNCTEKQFSPPEDWVVFCFFFCFPGFCSSLQRQPPLKITVTHFQAKHSQKHFVFRSDSKYY